MQLRVTLSGMDLRSVDRNYSSMSAEMKRNWGTAPGSGRPVVGGMRQLEGTVRGGRNHATERSSELLAGDRGNCSDHALRIYDLESVSWEHLAGDPD